MHFQPGGSHGWGLLSVYEPSFGPQFEALLRAVGKLQTQQTPRQTDTRGQEAGAGGYLVWGLARVRARVKPQPRLGNFMK